MKDLSQNKANNFAEIQWIKWVQENHYADVFNFLMELKGNNLRSLEGKKIVRTDKLNVPLICLNLHLILDKDGGIRIKTSLTNCPNLTFDQFFLIPAKDAFTNHVIVHNHNLSGHMSLHNTRSQLRHRFWIPKDTSAISSVVRKCTSCT